MVLATSRRHGPAKLNSGTACYDMVIVRYTIEKTDVFACTLCSCNMLLLQSPISMKLITV